MSGDRDNVDGEGRAAEKVAQGMQELQTSEGCDVLPVLSSSPSPPPRQVRLGIDEEQDSPLIIKRCNEARPRCDQCE